MYSEPDESRFEKIMNYIFNNPKKALIVVSVILLVVIMIVILGKISKKEDPKYTEYSCGKLFSSATENLTSDKVISALSSTSFESEINFVSGIFNELATYSRVLNLVNESRELISLVEQNKSNQQAKSIIIPKNACYITLNDDGIQQNQLNLQPKIPNLEIYQWVKKYRKHLSDKIFIENNFFFTFDNYSFHIKQSTDSEFFIPVMKSQITVYSLDL